MEFPTLGKHCTKSDCNKLDFLPIRCDSCKSIFCDEHFAYSSHNCHNVYQKNNQVPVCPLCNVPIPVQRGQHPDYIVGAHIDAECQSDPAKSHRKIFTNKCSYKKCKTKELLPISCSDCCRNFCLKHRHPTDHSCQGKVARKNNGWIFKAQQNSENTVQENMSEDEALARALALSMQDSGPCSTKKQEELDLALARQLQASEQATTAGSSRDRCQVS